MTLQTLVNSYQTEYLDEYVQNLYIFATIDALSCLLGFALCLYLFKPLKKPSFAYIAFVLLTSSVRPFYFFALGQIIYGNAIETVTLAPLVSVLLLAVAALLRASFIAAAKISHRRRGF